MHIYTGPDACRALLELLLPPPAGGGGGVVGSVGGGRGAAAGEGQRVLGVRGLGLSNNGMYV